MPIKLDEEAFKKLAEEIVQEHGVPRMKRVAEACNSQAGLEDDYRVSTEGEGQHLNVKDRATVITATAAAMDDNAKNNRLLQNFHLAGSAD